MENQDFNKELVDYLYGEMSARERKDFEQKLQTDAELRKEWEMLNSVRGELNRLEDKEIMEPFSTWGRAKYSGWFGSFAKKRTVIFRPVTAVAASLIILMLIGYLTNFSISINTQGVFVGYGKSGSNESMLTKEEIGDMVQQEVEKNNAMLLAKLSESESSLENRFSSLEGSFNDAKVKNNQGLTNEDVQKYLASVEKRNLELMKEYLKLSTTQQQEYFKTMLTQFNDFMQEQREQDLTMIRNSMMELKQTQTIQKQETDQLLAGILTSVSQKSQN